MPNAKNERSVTGRIADFLLQRLIAVTCYLCRSAVMQQKFPWTAPIPRKTAASSDIFLFHILTFQTKTNSKNFRRRTLLKIFFNKVPFSAVFCGKFAVPNVMSCCISAVLPSAANMPSWSTFFDPRRKPHMMFGTESDEVLQYMDRN